MRLELRLASISPARCLGAHPLESIRLSCPYRALHGPHNLYRHHRSLNHFTYGYTPSAVNSPSPLLWLYRWPSSPVLHAGSARPSPSAWPRRDGESSWKHNSMIWSLVSLVTYKWLLQSLDAAHRLAPLWWALRHLTPVQRPACFGHLFVALGFQDFGLRPFGIFRSLSPHGQDFRLLSFGFRSGGPKQKQEGFGSRVYWECETPQATLNPKPKVLKPSTHRVLSTKLCM